MASTDHTARLSPSPHDLRYVAGSPSPSVQHFAQPDGSRLIENLESLVMVIVAVVTARINAAKRFMSMARASSSAYDVKDLALGMPLPSLHGADMSFVTLAFAAACDTLPTPFDGPRIDVQGFLVRVVERSQAVCEDGVSNSALLLMLIYVDKLYAKCPALMLSEGNAARLMAAAYALAAKVLEDVPYGLTAMARVLGVRGEVLRQLESAFVQLLDYELQVSSEEFIEAEVSFMAEALETEVGGEILGNLHMAGVSGLEQALAVAKNWVTEDHTSTPWVMREGQAGEVSSNCLSYVGERTFWRCFPGAQCQWVEEESMRNRIAAVACAQYRMDFRHIGLEMEEEKGEWYAMAICEREGVERFRRLRAILLRKDFSVTEIPEMRKRPVPFMAIPQGCERRSGEDFVTALGEQGRRLVAENWRTALVIPDPREEAAEDAGLELAPLPAPVWHIRRMWGGDQRDSGDRHGEHACRGSGPSTPVGSCGGVVSVNPPIFHDPDMLLRIQSAPPCYDVPSPPPRRPPGFSNQRRSQQLSPQYSHPPGFPSRPPSPRRDPAPRFSDESVSMEHHGPPGFPPRPASANNDNPPGFPTQLGSPHGHPAAIFHTPRRCSHILREEEASTLPEVTVSLQPRLRSGPQCVPCTPPTLVLGQTALAAAGDTSRGPEPTAGKRANRTPIARSGRRGKRRRRWVRVQALELTGGPSVASRRK
eukprot:GFKZ01007007.1.p1 GENE.GFKZ01007007.1~~GFKZ01007007.1.p1  ORF type:complete len:707 (+),score=58.67 GFKZ01007007.1:603-2723(+)